MKAAVTLLTGIIILFSSCGNSQHEAETKDSSGNQTPGKTFSENCYRYINNNDTVILKITESNGAVSGTLLYNFYEKDKNTGTIKGEMKGDLLVAEYSFHAEGMESVRAVAFKKMGKNFMEGYGESEMRDGKDVFKNLDALSFSNSVLLSPYDCEK